MAKRKQPIQAAPLTRQQILDRERESFFRFDKTPDEAIPTPTRTFQVGERCMLGNLNNCVVAEVICGGKAYIIEHDVIGSHKSTVTPPERSFLARWWYDVVKVGTRSADVPHLMDPWKRPHLTVTVLESVINYLDSGGLVCDPLYQREYVWTERDKDALLESLFERLEIGPFTFIRHAGYLHAGDKSLNTYRSLEGNIFTIAKEDDYTVAIIDGQQRITTIMDFMFDRRPYKGIFFLTNELP